MGECGLVKFNSRKLLLIYRGPEMATWATLIALARKANHRRASYPPAPAPDVAPGSPTISFQIAHAPMQVQASASALGASTLGARAGLELRVRDGDVGCEQGIRAGSEPAYALPCSDAASAAAAEYKLPEGRCHGSGMLWFSNTWSTGDHTRVAWINLSGFCRTRQNTPGLAMWGQLFLACTFSSKSPLSQSASHMAPA